MKIVFLIVGESGSGKTTICNALGIRYGYKTVKSSTTRERRYTSENNYHFVTLEEYEHACEKGIVIAPTFFDNNYYFVTSDILINSDLYIVDKAGVQELKNNVKNIKFVVIYISVDEYTRKMRMIERKDAKDKIEMRIKNDRRAFEGLEYDYVVKNINLEECISDIVEIINSNLSNKHN